MKVGGAGIGSGLDLRQDACFLVRSASHGVLMRCGISGMSELSLVIDALAYEVKEERRDRLDAKVEVVGVDDIAEEAEECEEMLPAVEGRAGFNLIDASA